MNYTKAQRHRIYKEAKKLIQSKYHECICLAIVSCINDFYDTHWSHYMLEHDFPEVYKQKPKKVYSNILVEVWFPASKRGREKRLAILRKAI